MKATKTLVQILTIASLTMLLANCTRSAKQPKQPEKKGTGTEDSRKTGSGGSNPDDTSKNTPSDDQNPRGPSQPNTTPQGQQPQGNATPVTPQQTPSTPNTPPGTQATPNTNQPPTVQNTQIKVNIGGATVDLDWDGLSHKDTTGKYTISDKKI